MSPSHIRYEHPISRALRDNPLGDPSERTLPVYLPPGYEESDERFPVLFLLAGFTGSGHSFLNWSGWEENIQQRMDRLISQGQARRMILVMPNCFTRYGGSQYLNSPATGNYRDYLLELVQYVDEHFRTIPERDHRAIAGKSSGGYGALTVAMQHPETFGLVADHSGDKYFELCYKADFPRFLKAVERFGGLERVLSDPSAIRPKDSDFHALMNVAAMSACYSPNPGAPLGFDLPLDPRTGELDTQVWRRWLSHDPVQMVADYAEALKSLRLLFLDCGSRDEFNLQYGCRIFVQRLQALGVAHTYQEFEDGHFNISYRFDVSIPLISQSMPA